MGYDSILTITDHDCSKAVLFYPCKEAMGTKELAKLYFMNVFPHYGIPKKIISDQDPQLHKSQNSFVKKQTLNRTLAQPTTLKPIDNQKEQTKP